MIRLSLAAALVAAVVLCAGCNGHQEKLAQQWLALPAEERAAVDVELQSLGWTVTKHCCVTYYTRPDWTPDAFATDLQAAMKKVKSRH